MRRRLALSLLVLAALFACSRPDKNAEKSKVDLEHPVKGDWAVVRLEAEPDTLNPLISTLGVARYVMWGVNNSQIYELLMNYNTRDWGLTEPLLAEAPPVVSDDHLTYTITVRDGVKWHDGQPFTADDVVFTFKSIASPLTDAADKRSYLTDLADIQVDGRTVRFTMSRPNV